MFIGWCQVRVHRPQRCHTLGCFPSPEYRLLRRANDILSVVLVLFHEFVGIHKPKTDTAEVARAEVESLQLSTSIAA
jgi:hypothetical protein